MLIKYFILLRLVAKREVIRHEILFGFKQLPVGPLGYGLEIVRLDLVMKISALLDQVCERVVVTLQLKLDLIRHRQHQILQLRKS